MGRRLVRLVQRMLFWYTPQINRFNGAVTASVEALCITLEKLFSNQMRLWEEVQTLHKEIQKFNAQNALIQGRLQSETHASSQPRQRNSADNPSVQVPLPPDFTFRLQDRFRGSEEETKNKLRKHLDTLQDLRPSALNRPWLDIGTGRGEWVELAKVSGHSITGIDVNPVAGKYCSSRGLPVIQSEALAYLRSQSEESYSVVTLFPMSLSTGASPIASKCSAKYGGCSQTTDFYLSRLLTPDM